MAEREETWRLGPCSKKGWTVAETTYEIANGKACGLG